MLESTIFGNSHLGSDWIFRGNLALPVFVCKYLGDIYTHTYIRAYIYIYIYIYILYCFFYVCRFPDSGFTDFPIRDSMKPANSDLGGGRGRSTTYTHTHTYIYIYIYIINC